MSWIEAHALIFMNFKVIFLESIEKTNEVYPYIYQQNQYYINPPLYIQNITDLLNEGT